MQTNRYFWIGLYQSFACPGKREKVLLQDRSYLKKRILVQGQGGREVQPGGASEANALRGEYSCILRT
jgi:hypothetical protein